MLNREELLAYQQCVKLNNTDLCAKCILLDRCDNADRAVAKTALSLMAQVDELTAYIERLGQTHARQYAEVCGENEQLMEMLKELEWGAVEYRSGRYIEYCPYCKNDKPDGHTLDCELAKLLEVGE